MGESSLLYRRLLEYYSRDFELASPFLMDNSIYDTYARYSTGGSNEHAFLRNTMTLSVGDLNQFRDQIIHYVEPNLVCEGLVKPSKDHLYTYVTGIFISDDPIPDEVRQNIKKFRYYKSYGLLKHGYVQARIAAFDMTDGTFITSPAAKNLLEEYKRVLS